MMALPAAMDSVLPVLSGGPEAVIGVTVGALAFCTFLFTRARFTNFASKHKWPARLVMCVGLLAFAIPLTFVPFATLVLLPSPIEIDRPNVMAVSMKQNLAAGFLTDELATRIPVPDPRFVNCVRIALLSPLTMDSNGDTLPRKSRCNVEGQCVALPKLSKQDILDQILAAKKAFVPFVAKACDSADLAQQGLIEPVATPQ